MERHNVTHCRWDHPLWGHVVPMYMDSMTLGKQVWKSRGVWAICYGRLSGACTRATISSLNIKHKRHVLQTTAATHNTTGGYVQSRVLLVPHQSLQEI
jgi:hypothetical protein